MSTMETRYEVVVYHNSTGLIYISEETVLPSPFSYDMRNRFSGNLRNLRKLINIDKETKQSDLF